MFALPQFKSQNAQAYPIGPPPLPSESAKHASTNTMPPRKVRRVDISSQTESSPTESSQTEGLRCPSPEPELKANAPIDFQHHPESMRLSITPVRQKPTETDGSRPQFVVRKAALNRQLQQLVCADTGGLSQQMFILPCGHNRAELTATAARTVRKRGSRDTSAPVPCANSQCQRICERRSVRVVTFDRRLRELVDKIFSPQPEPPHFSRDDATALFEGVCQRITAILRPPTTSDREATTETRIQSATNAALAIITGTPCADQVLPAPTPPEPVPEPTLELAPEPAPERAPEPAQGKRKERRRDFLPYTMSIEEKHYSQPLPNIADTDAATDGRLTLIYLIDKHQKHYHTEKQLRFVEHLPNTLAGRKLADNLSEAAGRGLRLLTSHDDRGRLIVDWNPNLPAHTDRNRPFPRGGVERLQKALDDAS